MKRQSSSSRRNRFSVVDQTKVAVFDSTDGTDGRAMRYETAQCVADLFNQFVEPRRKFVVVHDGRPVKRRDGRMQRFYANLERLRA